MPTEAKEMTDKKTEGTKRHLPFTGFIEIYVRNTLYFLTTFRTALPSSITTKYIAEAN